VLNESKLCRHLQDGDSIIFKILWCACVSLV
jgi:hypothetical protein